MLASQLKKYFNEEEFYSKLKGLYIDEILFLKQVDRYNEAVDKYMSIFGDNDVEIYSVPGRSEVCGNHTDHQQGRVLAAAINLDCIAIVSKSNDNIINVVSDGFDVAPININSLIKVDSEEGTTESLIKGVSSRLKELGYSIGGFNAYITSDVLIGAGLSSSACFEVMIGTILSGLYNDMSIDPVEIAKVSQYAENVYFGKPSGLMDQMACSVGSMITIDFEDSEDIKIKKIDIDFDSYDHSLCIIDTKGSHANLTGEYAAIPFEMKEVANYFGKNVLTEVDEDEFNKEIMELSKRFGGRAVLRAMHLFAENKRVTKAVAALEAHDFNSFKKIIASSGDSSFKYLQNVYANSNIHEQNLAIALAVSENVLEDNGICRVHGGGFAGTIQAFVPNNLVFKYKDSLDKVFGAGSCLVLKVRKHGGIRVL